MNQSAARDRQIIRLLIELIANCRHISGFEPASPFYAQLLNANRVALDEISANKIGTPTLSNMCQSLSKRVDEQDRVKSGGFIIRLFYKSYSTS